MGRLCGGKFHEKGKGHAQKAQAAVKNMPVNPRKPLGCHHGQGVETDHRAHGHEGHGRNGYGFSLGRHAGSRKEVRRGQIGRLSAGIGADY